MLGVSQPMPPLELADTSPAGVSGPQFEYPQTWGRSPWYERCDLRGTLKK
jgi:hypothetical protein